MKYKTKQRQRAGPEMVMTKAVWKLFFRLIILPPKFIIAEICKILKNAVTQPTKCALLFILIVTLFVGIQCLLCSVYVCPYSIIICIERNIVEQCNILD